MFSAVSVKARFPLNQEGSCSTRHPTAPGFALQYDRNPGMVQSVAGRRWTRHRVSGTMLQVIRRYHVDFIGFEEGLTELKAIGVRHRVDDDDRLRLSVAEKEEKVVHLHIATPECGEPVQEGAKTITLSREALREATVQMIHRLHLAQFMLLPMGKWRNVFDAVAFSLAANEDWQAVDAAATVELNTRDPLVCGPADVNLLIDLIGALMNDAERADQGLTLMTTAAAAPVLIEVVPDGVVRIACGNMAIADKILKCLPSSSS